MRIFFTDAFKKRFKKLNSKIQKQFEARIGLFIKDTANPLLRNHPLKGNLVGLRAFSISGDYRVIYKILGKESIKLIDIGTHNQIY